MSITGPLVLWFTVLAVKCLKECYVPTTEGEGDILLLVRIPSASALLIVCTLIS